MNRRAFLRVLGAVAGLGLSAFAGEVSLPEEDEPREKIAKAIRSRTVLLFRYHGFVRQVEPHALGQITNGRLALLAWQTEGGSESEPPPGWRTFVVREIAGLRKLDKTFLPRPEYQRGRTRLKNIEVEITT